MLCESKRKKLVVTTLLLAIFVFNTSRDASASAKSKNGHYEGYLRVYPDFRPNIGSDSAKQLNPDLVSRGGKSGNSASKIKFFKGKKWVSVDIKRQDRDGTIEITDPRTKEALINPIKISHIGFFNGLWNGIWRGIHLSIPSIEGEFDLTRRGTCYYSKADSPYTVRACLKQTEDIAVTVSTKDKKPVYRLWASPFSQPKVPDGPIDIQKAIEIALATSPASHSELELKMQARNSSHAAWARVLTPRVNLPSTIAIAYDPTNPLTYIQAIGNLAPFLSIGHWIDAFESDLQREIADYSYKISRADLATQVESLVYAYRRDVAVYQEYDKLLPRAKDILEKTKVIEALGKSPSGKFYISPGSSDTMDSTVRGLETLIIDTKNALATDKYALVRALGVHDIDLIKNIKIGIEYNPLRETVSHEDHKTFTYAKPIRETDIASAAMEASLEREQSEIALQVADLDKKALYLRLLDPVGDPDKGFGLNTLWEGKTNDGKYTQLLDQFKDLDNQIDQGARNSVVQFNSSLAGFVSATKNQEDTKKNLDRLTAIITDFKKEEFDDTIGSEFDIQGSFQSYSAAVAQTKNYLAGYRIARATLDRMLLQGYFSKLGKSKGPSSSLGSGISAVAEDDDIDDTAIIDGEEEDYVIYNLTPLTSYQGKEANPKQTKLQ